MAFKNLGRTRKIVIAVLVLLLDAARILCACLIPASHRNNDTEQIRTEETGTQVAQTGEPADEPDVTAGTTMMDTTDRTDTGTDAQAETRMPETSNLSGKTGGNVKNGGTTDTKAVLTRDSSVQTNAPDTTAASAAAPETVSPPHNPEAELFDSSRITLSFAAMSDSHIGDINTEQSLTRALQYMPVLAGTRLDGWVFAGDLTNSTGLTSSDSEIYKFKEIFERETTGGFMLYCLGSWHDLTLGKVSRPLRSLFHDTFGSKYFALDTEPEDVLECGIRHINVKGFDFFAVDYEGENSGTYSTRALNYLDTTLESAVKANPTKPIFVIMHVPGTVQIDNILKQYPQVICFTGHLHNSVAREDSISQDKGFTQIHCGGLNYYRVDAYNRVLSDAFLELGNIRDFAQALLVQVDANNNVRVLRVDAYNAQEIEQRWYLCSSDLTRYTASRADTAEPSSFEDGTKLNIEVNESGSISLTFDPCRRGGAGPIIYYDVELYAGDLNEEYTLVDTKSIASRQVFYPNDEGMSDLRYTCTFVTTGSTEDFAVVVRARDCWNYSSNALVCTNGSYAYPGETAKCALTLKMPK